MAELIKLRWSASMASGLPRRAHRGCDYEAYVPDRLSGRAVTFSGETAADVADAERAVERLNRAPRGLADSEALARLLLRAEAVASSKIEGLAIGSRRLLKAQLAHGLGEKSSDVTATEVLNNIEAMRQAVEAATAADAITVEDLLAVHGRLLAGTQLERYAGELRHQQNWIGGSSHNPCTADFVSPPPERVVGLLEDLCAFCSADALPTLAQAALAHSQFETIHPFIDGNGRTGRALIHMILRRRGLAPLALPPVSLVLATWSRDYVEGLNATRSPPGASAVRTDEGLNAWISLFAAAARRAVADAEDYERRVAEINSRWRESLGRVRADSAVDRLLSVLPGAPILTVRTAAALTGRSEQAVNEAIPRLLEAGVLEQTTVGRRNRAFEAADLIDAFTDLERQLASPEADTHFSRPERIVPERASRR
jgi:Fic family protein